MEAVAKRAGLAPLRERFAAWQARLADDGIDPAAATAVRRSIVPRTTKALMLVTDA
ncbi:hypothetical protein ACGFNP_37690 [Nonomuraea sp. NPDC049269]|uniref:hypothetical protein n=1 Tax=Nonomuraea sp. NPDC049269 TaxID=3364349 RepID=UPI00371406B8